MKDLISRQAAIEAVRSLQTYKMFAGDDLILVDKAVVQAELEILPSVREQYKRPVGEWECLGHRMGFLKHPWSIDYKCSVCGYEQYAIGFMPPKTCPECGADMRESVLELERQKMFPEEEKDESNVRD